MQKENIVEMVHYQPKQEKDPNGISKELEAAIKNLIEKLRNNERVNHKING
jgi:hypothetical protein